MTCPVDEKLTEHLLDETSGAERDVLAAHLGECAQCGAEARELRETIAALREQAPPSALALDATRRKEIAAAASRPPRARMLPLAAAAAATLLVALLATRYIPNRPLVEPLAHDTPRSVDRDESAAPSAPKATSSPSASVEEATVRREVEKLSRDMAQRETTAKKDEFAPAEVPQLPARPLTLTATGSDQLRGLGYVDASRANRLHGVAGGVSGGVEGGVSGGVVGGVLGGIPDDNVGELRRFGRPMAPPNGAPAADMFFEHQGTNPFVQTNEDPLSTFGLDVDTASYAIARSYLLRGALPPAAAVRVEEFVNAFPHGYATDPEKAFAIHLAAAPNPFHAGYHLLRVGLKAREIDVRERKPAILTFVIDVSGSMAQENRLGLVKRSLELLVDKLDDRDRIGIVVYGSSGRALLQPTSVGEDRGHILRVIEQLQPEGSTNLEEGLDLGYDMAWRHFRRGASNRVVLCTDGVANNGLTAAEDLLRQVEHQARRGIDLMALGFGMGNYNDVLLQKLADQGNGQYAYIDDVTEARSFFLRDLTAVLEVVARDAKAQVEFDPRRVDRYRLIGYEKRDVADRDFRNDAVDGGEVNSGHAVTVLYEVKLKAGAGGVGVVRVRYQDPDTKRAAEEASSIGAGVFAESFERADPDLRRDAVVARFAEHLRKSYWVKDEPLSRVLREARRLPAGTLRTEPVAELVRLIRATLRERGADDAGE